MIWLVSPCPAAISDRPEILIRRYNILKLFSILLSSERKRKGVARSFLGRSKDTLPAVRFYKSLRVDCSPITNCYSDWWCITLSASLCDSVGSLRERTRICAHISDVILTRIGGRHTIAIVIASPCLVPLFESCQFFTMAFGKP